LKRGGCDVVTLSDAGSECWSFGDCRRRLPLVALLEPLYPALGTAEPAMTDREITLLICAMLIIAALLIWGSIRFIDTFVFASLSAPPAG
jgi:hypothetical protein